MNRQIAEVRKNSDTRKTVDYVAKEILKLKVYDCSLPQEWVNSMAMTIRGSEGKDFYIPGHFVWGYDDSPIFGRPIGITNKGRELLGQSPIPQLD